MTNLKPSRQQSDIINQIRRNKSSLIVEAVAGSGKTSTLLMLVPEMTGSVCFAAFNKSIAAHLDVKLNEVKNKASKYPAFAKAATFHSLGFSLLREKNSYQVDFAKVKTLIRSHHNQRSQEEREFLDKLVSVGKQAIYDGEERDILYDAVEHHSLDLLLGDDAEDSLPELIDAAHTLIGLSNRQAREGVIDFDDMMYLPLLWGAQPRYKYDWFLIDEAQDTNRARRELAKLFTKDNGTVIAVGDRHQAIYGFTGADADSLDLIKDKFRCTRYPLSVSYRCAPEIVAHAREIVPTIQPWDQSPPGTVSKIREGEFSLQRVPLGSAILCRLTKPLITLALSGLRDRVPCFVEGRDIGKGLISLAHRWDKSISNVQALGNMLGEYKIEQVNKYLARDQEVKAQQVVDQIDSLQAILESLSPQASIYAVDEAVAQIFNSIEGRSSENYITLSTIHKAKGREWDNVYLYGRNKFMPSRYAKKQWQMDQERNLAYVAITRAKRNLIEVEI